MGSTAREITEVAEEEGKNEEEEEEERSREGELHGVSKKGMERKR